MGVVVIVEVGFDGVTIKAHKPVNTAYPNKSELVLFDGAYFADGGEDFIVNTFET